jgi:hypothetical protein
MNAKNCVAIFNLIEHTPSFFLRKMPPLYERGIGQKKLKFPFYKGVALRSNDGVCSIYNSKIKDFAAIKINRLPRIPDECLQWQRNNIKLTGNKYYAGYICNLK